MPKFSLEKLTDVRNGIAVGGVKSWKELPKEGVVLILGEQGEGKSALGWWLATAAKAGTLPGWRASRRDIIAFKLPETARKLLPKKIKFASTIAELKRYKNAFIIYDETAGKDRGANARRSMSSGNVDLMELNALGRQFGHLIFYIAQHSKQPDSDIIANARWILYKHPSILHIRFTRPELRSEVELAWELFAKLPKRADRRRYVVVVDYREGRAGVLQNGLPRFWSEKLSTVFASGAERKE